MIDLVELRSVAQKIAMESGEIGDERDLRSRLIFNAANEIERMQIKLNRRELIALQILENAIDRMGWDEINAFNNELYKGQDYREDAGGYMLRCFKKLFGIKKEFDVINYQDAARALVKKANYV